MTAAEIIPMRPRATDDAERLWWAYNDSRERMETLIRAGHTDMALVCACGDAYRAWLRAYTRDHVA